MPVWNDEIVIRNGARQQGLGFIRRCCGADALLAALAAEGIRHWHTLLNLGLGINPGIVFFKRKWNATILRPHVETSWAVQRPQEAGLLGSLKKLFGM